MLSPLPEIPFTHCLSHPPSTFIRLTAQNPLRSAYFTSPFPKTFLDVLPSIKISLSTPLLLPGKSHGQRSLVGYSPWGNKESDMTEQLHFLYFLSFFLWWLRGKEYACQCRRCRSDPWVRKEDDPGEGHGNPLQYS